MATIRLLAAPVILPPASDVSGESANLVPSSRLASATRAITRSDTAYPVDRYIWSASAGDDGTFHFYAMPATNFGNDSASEDGSESASGFGFSWYAASASSAVAAYQMHASAPAMYGQLINVYA